MELVQEKENPMSPHLMRLEQLISQCNEEEEKRAVRHEISTPTSAFQSFYAFVNTEAKAPQFRPEK